MKTSRRKTAKPKRSQTAAAAWGRNSAAEPEKRKVARLARELQEARDQQAATAIENARLLKELRESLEQQTATSEVLQVISSSPGELKPVFETMLANAVRICEAKFGYMFLYEGDGFHAVALHGAPQAYSVARLRQPVIRPSPNIPLGRVLSTKRPVHVADVRLERAYLDRDPTFVDIVDLGGARTLVGVPMLKEDELVGAIGIYRQEVRPFTDKQIKLVQSFANQAVIAIENARLLNELHQRTTDLSEALEQQTATSEVLGVISSSPTDLAPVFEIILTNATRLCEGNFAVLWQFDGDGLVGASHHNVSPGFAELCRNTKLRPGPEGAVRKAALERHAVHVPDITVEPGFSPVVLQFENARTVLAVPLLREQDLLGVIGIWRREVKPFTEHQAALVRTFADQAAIAIENARLLNELRESLAQQTATADVLRVISSSPGGLEPVFTAMLENALRICEAKFGMLNRYVDGAFVTQVMVGAPPALVEALLHKPFKPPPGIPLDRLLRTKKLVHRRRGCGREKAAFGRACGRALTHRRADAQG